MSFSIHIPFYIVCNGFGPNLSEAYRRLPVLVRSLCEAIPRQKQQITPLSRKRRHLQEYRRLKRTLWSGTQTHNFRGEPRSVQTERRAAKHSENLFFRSFECFSAQYPRAHAFRTALPKSRFNRIKLKSNAYLIFLSQLSSCRGVGRGSELAVVAPAEHGDHNRSDR